jgi:S1-C subfamily serine protease
MLGVQLSNHFTPDIARSLGLDNARGAWVSEVVEGGSADQAGIKAGDVITSINGRTIANASELRNSIGVLRIGDKVEIGLLREGKPRRVTAVIGDRTGPEADAASQIHPAFEGATFSNADGGAGVLVQSVAPASPAAQAGLRANDIILGVGRERITNIEQLRAAVKNGTAFAITIQRGRSRLVFPVG